MPDTSYRPDSQLEKQRRADELKQTAKFGDYPNAAGEDLSDTSMACADMYSAQFNRANLRNVYFRETNLVRAQLDEADLTRANFGGADLRGASLHLANLTRVRGLGVANLHGVAWDGLQLHGLPSGSLVLYPTPEGWRVDVGCWTNGTPDGLQKIADSTDPDDWPEADEEDIPERSAYLNAALKLVYLHIGLHHDRGTIQALADRWAPKTKQTTPLERLYMTGE